MCKLAGWSSSNHSPLDKKSANNAIVTAATIISRTERCGFGFAQRGATGLRTRFVTPSTFRDMDSLATFYKRAGKNAEAFAACRGTSQEGAYKPQGSVMIHGRTATCDVNLTNTHPFRRNGWTLAHNGVIDWEGDESADRKAVTCDSQHLLLNFTEQKSTDAARDAMQHISGYAAFIAFAPSGRMIVARDATASLYAGITSKGRWIFGTTKEIVEKIAESWKCKGVDAYLLDDWTWMEFPATSLTPDCILTWKHKVATKTQWSYSSKSLGFAAGTSAAASATTTPAVSTDRVVSIQATPARQLELTTQTDLATDEDELMVLTNDEIVELMEITGGSREEILALTNEEIDQIWEYELGEQEYESFPDYEGSRSSAVK